eukprot:gene14219-20189_t
MARDNGRGRQLRDMSSHTPFTAASERPSHSSSRTPSGLQDRSVAEHPEAMSSEAAEPPKTLKRVKSVNFGVPQEDGEDCDVPRSTTMSSSMRSKQLSKGKQRSFAAGNFEAGSEWQN